MHSLRRSALFALVVLIAWLAVVYLGTRISQAKISKGPTLTTKAIDLGEVCQGDLKEATFTIENRSSDTVRLIDATASCSCTAAHFSASLLKPSEKAAMFVTVNTGGNLGGMESSVRVNWEIPRTSQKGDFTAVVAVKSVRKAVSIPKILDLGSIDVDGGISDSIVEINHGEFSVPWNGLEARSEKCGELRVNETQGIWRVYYKFDPTGRAVGAFRDDIAIQLISTSGRIEGVMHVPVVGRLNAKITVIPQSIMFSTVAQSQLCEGDVALQTLGSEPLSFLNVKCDDTKLQFSGKCFPMRNGLRFHYTFKAPDKSGPLVSTVRFSVKNDKVRIVAVPLLAFVRGSPVQ